MRLFTTLLRFVSALSFVFSPTLAYSKTYQFSGDIAARAVANYISNAKTIGEIVESFRGVYSKEEQINIEKLFKPYMAMAAPKCSAKNNSVRCGTSILTFTSEKEFNIDGRVVRVSQSTKIDQLLKELSAKQSGIENLFIPKAFAEMSDALHNTLALAGVVVVMGASAFAGRAAPYLLIGAALVFLGYEVYHIIRDGEVTCKGKDFSVRRRSNHAVLTSKDFSLSPELVTQILREPIKACDEAAAKKLKKHVDAFNQEALKTLQDSSHKGSN